jgi:hypothetical protein
MSVDTGLINKLSLIVGPGVPVQQNYASADKTQPRVWVQRQQGDSELFLDGRPGPADTTYAVEVNALDPDAGAAVADAIQANAAAGGLDGFRGTMNSTVVLGCFVGEASDDYVPRGLELDDGYHVFAFTVRVLT